MKINIESIKSPKQIKPSKFFREDWYPYYAGFSSAFVESIFSSVEGEISSILDPWNGGGTTTLVANAYGISSTGVDINPVMNIIAKARSISSRDVIRAKALIFDTVISDYSECEHEHSLLNNWFTDESCFLIERMFNYVLYRANITRIDVLKGNCDPSEAVALLSIIQSVRQIAHRAKSKNPTWTLRRLKDKIEIDKKELIYYIIKFSDYWIKDSLFRYQERPENIRLITSDSREIPIKNESFDLVIGSPPYATRIDYAVKMSIELGVIGYSVAEFNQLRALMLGTTTINPYENNEVLSNEARQVLEMIEMHSSKSSKSYYSKNYYDYFYKLEKSLKECSRLLKNEGCLVIVVQDSLYKEIHINLKRIVIESLENYGFSNFAEKNFVNTVSMKYINSGHKKYGSSPKPTESVIVAMR